MSRQAVYRCTIRQLAKVLGITRMGAHKAEAKATLKLQRALEREFAKDWAELNGKENIHAGTEGQAERTMARKGSKESRRPW
jgi:hypothetical protein